MGGPDITDAYADLRSDYVQNEVALDYNSGFQSAIAEFVILYQSSSSGEVLRLHFLIKVIVFIVTAIAITPEIRK